MTLEKKVNLPADPEIIDEYLDILNEIVKEKDRTPSGEPIVYDPISERKRTILKKIEQDYQLIEITEKTTPYIDPLGLDPYENIETIPAVIILDESKFNNFRNKLVRRKEVLIGKMPKRFNGRQPTKPNSDTVSITNANKMLKWEVFTLDIKSGEAIANEKPHNFNTKLPPFKIFKALLEKRVYNQDSGEVTYIELAKVTGITDKELIKSRIREMRRGFGINRNKNPEDDIFQETGKGFKLIKPKSLTS